MNRKWRRAGNIIALTAIILGACAQTDHDAGGANQSHGADTANMQSMSEEAGVPRHLHDPGTIPSYGGEKTQTTNERGNVSGGMGMNIYSTIGSSGVHGGGISSHIQSRLDSEGIEGIRVFVLDDTVILAQNHDSFSANQLDDLQWKLLSPTKGNSGKGETIDGLTGTDKGQAQRSLEQAKQRISQMFNNDVQILTCTNPEALQLIDQITEKLRSSPTDPQVPQDISKLLHMAERQ